jgi:hypothetical protein
MRKTDSAKYSQRKSIAMEFIYLGRNEGIMRDVHGKATDTVRQLLKSIHQKNLEREHTDVVGASSSGLQNHGKDDEYENEDEDEEPKPLRRRLYQQPRRMIQNTEGHRAEQMNGQGQGQGENGGNEGDDSPEALRAKQNPGFQSLEYKEQSVAPATAPATAPASTPIPLQIAKHLRGRSTVTNTTSSSFVESNRKRQR